LDVDLSSGSLSDYPIPDHWLNLYLGGRGIGARILLEELAGTEDPLSEGNILVFATGPFQGTGLLGAGRHAVLSLSPKTGSIADSYVGGYFGHELARTGYHGIIVRGISPDPVVLAIVEGKPELLSADDTWGQGTGKTEEILKHRYARSHIASIGIAGENLVQSACIIHDRSRAAGRPGLGAVMGSKRLKAVVVRGHREKNLYDRDRFQRERIAYSRLFLDGSMEALSSHGTAGFVVPLSESGILPTRNFQQGTYEDAKLISGETMADTILVGRESCAGCPIRCKRQVRTTSMGRDVTPDFGGPEYETVAAFGSLCLNNDLSAIALANQLCNDYGIDTISAGVACAFLMEASEKGIIEEDIKWGDREAIIRVIEQIAHREGVGDNIADGLESFAEKIGARHAMTIKGVELPMHEPRGKQGLAISYATSYRGATHMEAMHDTSLDIDEPAPELGVRRIRDRFSLADKSDMVKLFEDLRSFENSLILCAFTSRRLGKYYKYPELRSLLEAASGISISASDMLKIGERNYTLLQLLRKCIGLKQEEDKLPERFHEPLPSGASAGHAVDQHELQETIKKYYTNRGYADGSPNTNTLRALGMEECIPRARSLENRSKTTRE